MSRLLVLCICIALLVPGCNSGSGSGGSTQGSTGTQTEGTTTDSSTGTSTTQDEVYAYTWNDKIKVDSTYEDSTIKIAANLFTPVAKYDGQKFPAIIFINSWGLNEYEYLPQAIDFAKEGYLVLSYSCRGWGLSGGAINMFGPAERHDFSEVVDWLIANAPVDAANIAVSGISYGGMGALLAATFDARVKTCAALSPCIDMFRSMYCNETPELVWGSLLVATSMGRLAYWVYQMYLDTLLGQDIDWVYEMDSERSASNYVDMINAADKPMYLCQNFGDYMFQPNFALEYFNDLTVHHKRLDLNQGTHAIHEVLGMFSTSDSDIWTNVHAWMGYWLKGKDTGIIPDKDRSAVITMMKAGSIWTRVQYNTADLAKTSGGQTVYQWPANAIKTKRWYLSAGSTAGADGVISASTSSANTVSRIDSCLYSTKQMGVPLIREELADFGIMYSLAADAMDRDKVMVWQSEPLANELNIRGNAALNLNVSLSQARGQVFVYLYDLKANGTASFITHAYQTFWDATPNAEINLDLTFLTQAYTIPAGHRLMLAMNTSELLYGSPTTAAYTEQIHYYTDKAKQMVLSVPYE